MNKRFWESKLGIEIIISVIISLIVSFLVFFLLGFAERTFFRYNRHNHIISKEFIEENTKKEVDEFQRYIEENKVLTSDADKISEWVREKRNVMMRIYDGDRCIFDSTIIDFIPQKKGGGEQYNHNDRPRQNIYTIIFADKAVRIEMFCFFEYRFFVYMNYVNISISFISFVAVLMYFIRKITSYISKLERDIMILEGGDLDYSVTIKGNDEITSLAKSIEYMRISFLERLSEEEKARNANHKLVTAMSHDLRTPLTVLIGLLEILDGEKYSNEVQMKNYIKKSLDKCYQIKEMSDKIFEYFLAFDVDNNKLNIETFGKDVFNEMIGDYVFSLNEKGYMVDYDAIEEDISCDVDINYIYRVFDNIFSNFLKYADKEKCIKVYYRLENDKLKFLFENYITKKTYNIESTNIGLETCKNILSQLKGSFDFDRIGDVFRVTVQLERK